MNTETFVEKRTRNGHTFETTITVERTPASLSEHRMLRHRWFDYVVDHITECFEVKVTMKSGLSEWTDTFFEIVTPAGRGAVVMFKDHSEIDAFIPNSGAPLIHGCWKKYGQYRGHAISYMRAHKLNVNSKKVDHTCPARIYAIAAGRPWG